MELQPSKQTSHGKLMGIQQALPTIRTLLQVLHISFSLRFFRVRPSSSVDESLLTDILRLLTELLAARGGPDPELVQWLSGVVHTDQGALTALLSRPDHTQEDLTEGAQHSQRSVFF